MAGTNRRRGKGILTAFDAAVAAAVRARLGRWFESMFDRSDWRWMYGCFQGLTTSPAKIDGFAGRGVWEEGGGDDNHCTIADQNRLQK